MPIVIVHFLSARQIHKKFKNLRMDKESTSEYNCLKSPKNLLRQKPSFSLPR